MIRQWVNQYLARSTIPIIGQGSTDQSYDTHSRTHIHEQRPHFFPFFRIRLFFLHFSYFFGNTFGFFQTIGVFMLFRLHATENTEKRNRINSVIICFYGVTQEAYPAEISSFGLKSLSTGVTASSLLGSSINLVSSLSKSLSPLSEASSISESLGESGKTGRGFSIKDLGGGNGGGSSSLSLLALSPFFCESAPFEKYEASSSGRPS